MREMGMVLLLALLGPGGTVSTVAEDQEERQAQQKEQQQGQPDRKPAPKPTQPRTARPAPGGPATSPEPPPLRFTDFDLEKYHTPAPAEEEGSDGEQQDSPAAAGQAPGSGTTVPAPGTPVAKTAPPRRATAPRAPKPPTASPAADPLKTFREREAKEKFRAEQLQRARDRIAEIQSRLDYLKAKRDAIQNPAPLLVGQTRGQGEPGKPPPPPTPIQGPGRGLTPIPGTGKVPVMGLFPNLPPPQTDQDKENDKRMKTRDLLALVEEEIKGLETDLEQAQSELISIETRFAMETGGQ